MIGRSRDDAARPGRAPPLISRLGPAQHLDLRDSAVVTLQRVQQTLRLDAPDPPDAVVAPLPEFGIPKYSPVTMDEHMATTLGNLRKGVPSWDAATNTSRSATYDYGGA